MILTPSTPEFNKDGWISPSPIPKSLLPQENYIGDSTSSTSKDGISLKVPEGNKDIGMRRKAPTLKDLSALLRRQNPDKYDVISSLEVDPTPSEVESDPLITRRRLSISMSNALIRRQSIDISGSTPEGVNLSRRGSGAPTLASLGIRYLERSGSFKKNEESFNEGNKENEGVEDGISNLQVDNVDKKKELYITSNEFMIPNASSVKEISSKATKPSTLASSSTTSSETSTLIATPSISEVVGSTAESTSSETLTVPITTHPLQDSWIFYFSQKSSTSTSTDQSDIELKTIGEVKTLESFAPTFNYLKRPSQLASNASIYILKNVIEPNSVSNGNGGKWVLRIKGDIEGALVDKCWTWLVLAMVGDSLADESNLISGAVISIKPTFSTPYSPVLQLWINKSSIEDITSINNLGKQVLKLLELNDKIEHQIQFDFIPFSQSTTSSLGGKEAEKKKVSPFISINTYKKTSIGSSGRRDRGSEGITGGVLSSAMTAKKETVASASNAVGWRARSNSKVEEVKKV